MSETIEVRYRRLDGIGEANFYHKYISYTNSEGEKSAIAGCPSVRGVKGGFQTLASVTGPRNHGHPCNPT